jgi:hypothetical protein
MKKILQTMNEYWIVKDRRNGNVICHCADVNDAIMMVNFNPHHRSYSRHRFIMDQVIDITPTTDKQLPGQIGLPSRQIPLLNSHKKKLPEGQQKPVII